jgi:hypothetical protein
LQLQDILASLSVTLSPEHLELLEVASQIDLGFPHDFYRREMVRTFVYGGTRDQLWTKV